ncbi:hypothetical protein [Methanobrevibacter sp.]
MERRIAVFIGMVVMFLVYALLDKKGKSKIIIGILAGTVVAFILYYI